MKFFCFFNFLTDCQEIIGHSVKLNDVLEYAKLKSNFKELFYYCSADQSENSESDDTFESNFRDYKTILKIYYDDEEGYHQVMMNIYIKLL